MRLLTCIFFMMGLSLGVVNDAWAQSNFTLKGSVLDEANAPMASATVVVLDAVDSTMIQFTVTNRSGEFKVSGLAANNYILQISFVGYEMHYQNFQLAEDLNLEPIAMQVETALLDAVTLAAERLPLIVKGDTVQYNADAFKTKPNAVVEDLLKKLPGVEVDADGNIKAHGETVNKVMVDGKEFFGDDPKMATKNLPADAIDNVQVYDKMSEMAEFTGVDDGEREKTINLQLKEGAKAGYFGKSYLGGGYDPALYEGKVNVNRFNKKSQMSIIGMANNVNDQGFSMQDYIQFMGGISNLISSVNGGMLMLDPSDMGLAGMGGEGITHTLAGGVNYNRDWGKKTQWRSSYFLNRLGTNLNRQSSRAYFDTTQLASSEEDLNQQTTGFNNNFNYSFKHEIDSAQDIKVSGNVKLNFGDLNKAASTISRDSDGQRLNGFGNNNDVNSTGWNTDANLMYRKRLRKLGRSLVVNASGSFSQNVQESWVFTSSDQGELNQRQDYFDRRFTSGAWVNWTEPLPFGKHWFLEGNLRSGWSGNTMDKDFFDLQANDQEVFNPVFSNDFDFNTLTHRAGLKLQRNTKTMSIGATLAGQVTDQSGTMQGLQVNDQNYQALLPSAYFRYKFTGGQKLRWFYRSSLVIPELEQLQPVVDNSNPMSLYMGNPELGAATRHTSSLNFMYYSQFTFTSFFASLQSTYTENAIQNAVSTDADFRQVLMPVNVDYDFNSSLHANFSTPFRPLGIKIGVNARETLVKSVLPINGVENNLNRWIHSVEGFVENRKKEKWDVRVGWSWSLNDSRYSESPDFNQSFVNNDYFIDAIYYPNDLWALKTDFTYETFNSVNFNNPQAFPMWNASISKLFMKDNRGELELRLVDILNQNRGFRQSSQWNFIEERMSNNLGRHIMLRLSYSIKGFGSSAGKNNRPHGGRRSRS